ncbi:MAG TPA: penicillin-binding transpeptidase domain-containing protein, partial [Promineifilum sp.]|nr:penicillin-binding transpeptidase domain-containing protein [Promineifilum sp.]
AHLRVQSEAFWQDATRRLLHIAPVGGDVRLTLDADLQSLGNELMDSAGITGGLVLLELTEIGGESVADVRAMVSRPGYNPNRIDEEFETLSTAEPGPLVNRAAQGRYQPGLILQPLIVASAVDDGVLSLDAAIDDPFLPVALNGQVQRCATPRTEGDTRQYSWADMAALRCPAPLQALGQKLGGPALEKIFARFGLHQAPDLPIPTEGEAATITDAGLAAIGQEALTVTPLQVALAMSTLANDGLLPAPRLVDALADAGATWEAQPAGTPGDRPALVVAPGTTSAIRAGWPTNGDAAEFAVSVLAGPDNSRNAWYVGLAPAQNPRFVLALVVEGVSDSSSAESIGRQLLRRLASP